MSRVYALFTLLPAVAAPLHGKVAEPVCGRLANLPEIRAAFPATENELPLKSAHRLLRLFAENDGVIEPRETAELSLAPEVALYPLPWRVASERRKHMRLVRWRDDARRNEENMPAIVLGSGKSWCTSPLDWKRGARLRFEAYSLEPDNQAVLRVASGANELFSAELPLPRSLSALAQTDVGLDGEQGTLCFTADDGALALGEPRILVPENPGSDPRPRWVVLTILDAFRGDLLRDTDAEQLFPNLHRLSVGGQHYLRAVSPGCHTRASVWPILMGRDLMRIDRLKRRQSVPIESPLEDVYSRANLFVSQLAESGGYHSVFLGNNPYVGVVPAFSRLSRWSRSDYATVDMVGRLPELFSRYADERVLLVYYVSAAHAHFETPRRLFEALSCGELQGIEQCRCQYRARARQGDEAVGALQKGLRAYGLADDALHVVTADHGELFGDGMDLEGEVPTFTTGVRRGAFQSFDRGHGNGCHFRESDVPVIVAGKSIEPGQWREPVSGLDIVPTLVRLLRLPPPGRLDGKPLPLSVDAPPTDRPLVSYGFCADSVIDGDEQLIWWRQGCRVRRRGDGEAIEHRSELWSGGRRVATDRGQPKTLRRWMLRHEAWLRARLETEAFFFSTMNLPAADVVVSVDDARIVDYGPASTVYGLDRVKAVRLSDAGDVLTVRFEDYRGLYYVSTLPPRAPVRIGVKDHPDVLTFVGPMQLPLDAAGVALDPRARWSYFVAEHAPEPRPTKRPALRLWWQTQHGEENRKSNRSLHPQDVGARRTRFAVPRPIPRSRRNR